jgi:hypothetical protein
MATATPRLSTEELHLLKALSVGQPVRLPSAHRLRLEMMGLLRDGPSGPRLTELGMRQAQAAPSEASSKVEEPTPEAPVKRDRKGRRMPHGRALPFP